jgi:CRISPR locus-related DNA-binding protein
MSKAIIQVAIFDGHLEEKSERIAIQRRVDGFILVYPFKEQECVQTIIQWYKKMGMEILAVPVNPDDFQCVLSNILEAIDDYCMDDQIIEFNITCQNTILTIAACFAAMIIRAPIFSLTDSGFSDIVEIQSAKITTLTMQKRKILEQLSYYHNLVNQSDIARDMELSRSNVSRHIKALSKAGYIERKQEGRKKFVQITPLGTTILRHKLLRKRRIWDSSKLQSTGVVDFVG